jgi:hypothetical protein
LPAIWPAQWKRSQRNAEINGGSAPIPPPWLSKLRRVDPATAIRRVKAGVVFFCRPLAGPR